MESAIFQRLFPGRFGKLNCTLVRGKRTESCNASLYFPLAEKLFLRLSSSWKEAIVIGPSIAQRDPVEDVSAEAFPS